MSQVKNVLVCDDHGSRVDEWVELARAHLGDGWSVGRIAGADLATTVAALAEVEEASRNQKDRSDAQLNDQHARALESLDAADLVILDSDLTPSLEDGQAMGEASKQTLRNQMGDTVARQMRSYTSVGFVVVVNMFWGNYPADRVFDLTMMQGWRSFGDLHISEAELDGSALWSGESTAGDYHPWSWPALSLAPDWVRASEQAVVLDESVLATLGLDIDDFSPRQRDLFSEGSEVTFRQIAKSELGFRYPDAYHSDEQTTRMAASVIRRWLVRTLLAGQNVVSDAPHLLTRFSPILGAAESSIEAWNATTLRLDKTPAPLVSVDEARLSGVEPFVDRAVYSLAAVRELLSRREQLWLDPPQIVFAEDTSTFAPDDSAVAYQTDLPGTYSRRFVQRVSGVDYEPAPRLLV